jgi:hypothetical protein
MNGDRLVRAAFLAIGIGLAAMAAIGTATAAVRPPVAAPTTVVIRGATANPAGPSGNGNDQSGVTVLRGSPPLPAQPPAAQYACPGGYADEPGSGCVPLREPYPVYAPYADFGYWPYDYYGYRSYFGFVERRHHAFRRGFAAFRRPAFRPGFARGPRVGSAPGSAFSHRAVGFAHGSGGIGGFGHR